jgi:hypothetical protein
MFSACAGGRNSEERHEPGDGGVDVARPVQVEPFGRHHPVLAHVEPALSVHPAAHRQEAHDVVVVGRGGPGERLHREVGRPRGDGGERHGKKDPEYGGALRRLARMGHGQSALSRICRF